MDLLITIFSFLLMIGIVVTIHEAGHYFMSLWNNIRVVEFSIGFGPKILSKTIGKDKTKFTLRAFPFGGFVAPLDEKSHPQLWEELDEKERKRSFSNALKWQKFLMVAGGPLANFVLAFFIYFMLMLSVGTTGFKPILSEITANSIFFKSDLKENDEIVAVNNKEVKFSSSAYNEMVAALIKKEDIMIETSNGKKVTVATKDIDLSKINSDFNPILGLYFKSFPGAVKILKVAEDKPAIKAGIQEGDLIDKVNGKEVKEMGILLREIQNSPEQAVTLEILRNEKIFNVSVIPYAENEGGKKVGKIGVTFEQNMKQMYVQDHSFVEAFNEAIYKVKHGTVTTFEVLAKIVTGEMSTKNISGPLTMAEYSGKSMQMGFERYMLLIAAISISVGVLNLLPIPVLDGGHLTQYIIEFVRRKDFTMSQVMVFQKIGMSMIIFMMFIGLFNDLTRLIL